jgi:hypothetical protein
MDQYCVVPEDHLSIEVTDSTGPDGQAGPSDFLGGGVLRPPFAKLRPGRFDESLGF